MRSLLSRKVDSPARVVGLIVLFVMTGLSFVWGYFSQQSSIQRLRALQRSQITTLHINGSTITDEDMLHAIVRNLHEVAPYTSSNEGCLQPIIMRLGTTSMGSLRLAVAYSTQKDTAVIQLLKDAEVPRCMYGDTIASASLAQTLTQHGIYPFVHD